jgi:hypothetical protein
MQTATAFQTARPAIAVRPARRSVMVQAQSRPEVSQILKINLP